MRSIPRNEQETIIRWAADEDVATISTSNSVMIRKLDRMCASAPGDYKRIRPLSDAADAKYTMNVALLSFRSKHVERVLSDGQRAAARARMLEMRSALKTQTHETEDEK